MDNTPSNKSPKLALQDPATWSWGTRIFAGFAKLCYKAPLTVIIVCTLLAALCGYYSYRCLVFDSNRSNLIKRSAELQAKQDRFIAEFPNGEDIVVIVEGGTPKECEKYVDVLAGRLRAEPEVFDCAFEKVDIGFIRQYALHYLGVADLKRLCAGIDKNKNFLQAVCRSHSIIDLGGMLQNEDVGTLSDADLHAVLPAINGFIDQLQLCVDCRGRNFDYHSPWLSYVESGSNVTPEEAQGLADALKVSNSEFYSTLADGKVYIVLVRPTYTEGVDHPTCIERAIVRLKEIMHNMAPCYNTVIPRLTGELVLDYDEGQTSSADSVLSTVVSVVLVALIFMWAFHELYRPMMAIYALAIGVGWTMGFTTLVVGHLNLLTVTCTTILIGLGIDYGIHFIYRYEEERIGGLEPLPAMTETLGRAGKENFTGAFSTALAFWVLNLTDFTGIAELGTIAGGGILLCYLATVLVLPAFLYLHEKWGNNGKRQGTSSFAWLASLEEDWLGHPGLVVTLFLVFSLWCGVESCKVRYDYNLLNLQSQSLDSVQAELYLINSSEHSLLYGISLVDNVADAKRLIDAYQKLPSVASTECVALMVPENYREKAPYLRHITDFAATLPTPDPWKPSSGSMIKQLMRLGASVGSSAGKMTALLDQFCQSKDPEIAAQGQELKRSLEHLGNQLQGMLPGPIGDSLTAFDRLFFGDVRDMVMFVKSQKPEPQLTLADMPPALKAREYGKHGFVQVRVFPKENVWERSAQERFVRDVEKVDPQAVGMPIMTYYDSQVLREANEQAGIYALVAIWVLLFLYFRNIKLALLALMPKVVGVLWMVGIMGACGVNFNSANFLALPMILGIGLVFGIHVVHRVLEEDDAGIFGLSTGPSIALAALTTMAGFGTLMLASYNGIASLGFVMTVGVGANLVSSAVLLPAVIKLMRRKNIKLR